MSKRWSGRTDLTGQALDDENNRLLLERIARRSRIAGRTTCARRRTWMTSRELVCRGEVQGRILETRERRAAGSATIRIFSPTSSGKTFGEAAREEKETVSHRGAGVSRRCSSVCARNASIGEIRSARS